MTSPPALDIRNLRFRYSQQSSAPWIIDIESLALNAGEQVLLSGSSGSGKSTLLYLIAGLMEPNEGAIRVNGQDVHALRGEKRDLFRGKSIGMIFQTFNLLHGFTAAENVMMPMMFSDIAVKEHRNRAEQLLTELGLDEHDRPVDQLSIGQQQRVAVARAVACEPVLVLADEPTASLDPENAAQAMDLIQRTCAEHGAALLCTSHDPSMKDRFEREHAMQDLRAANAAVGSAS